MQRLALLPTMGLVLLAACSDTSTTSPTSARVMSPTAPRLALLTAYAPNGAHYRQGSGDPVCSINGITVTCTGTQIAGVGNTDANVALSVQYAATVQCRNHGGQIVDVKSQGTSYIPAPDNLTQLRNGTLAVGSFSASTVPSNSTFEGQATCPNGNWTKEVLGSATVVSYTYTLTFVGFSQPAIVVSGP
jgi:hypothetical protein